MATASASAEGATPATPTLTVLTLLTVKADPMPVAKPQVVHFTTGIGKAPAWMTA
jgi:hypothetical protein